MGQSSPAPAAGDPEISADGGKPEKSLQLFFWCGLSTLFWGIMFGGYFGDALDVIAKTFFGVSLPEGQSVIPALWFVPLNDPMRLLMYSLLFGCIHLFTGLGIKGYLCIKNKDYMAFLCDVVFWFLLILGLLLILIPSSMFASMFGLEVTFPAFVHVLAKGMAIGGALGILLFAGRRRKNQWGSGWRLALMICTISQAGCRIFCPIPGCWRWGLRPE